MNRQRDFTHGRWQVARFTLTRPGQAPDDAWIVDLVVVEGDETDDEADLVRHLERYRPSRGVVPDLGHTLDRAIRDPLNGRPHLPALVRVANEELAAEIQRARPEVRVVIGPTPLADDTFEDERGALVAELPADDEPWSWLAEGVTPGQVRRLFEVSERLYESDLSFNLEEDDQIFELSLPSLGRDRLWAHVILDENLEGRFVTGVAIAPDRAARDAWDSDASAESELDMYLLAWDTLSREAAHERQVHGWSPIARTFPRVVAGGDRERAPTPQEVDLVIAVIEALANAYDPERAEVAEEDTWVDVILASGEAARVIARRGECLPLSARSGQDDDDIDDIDDLDFDALDDDDEDLPDELADDLEFLELDGERAWTPAPPPAPATVRAAPKPGRNDPCWCGSGKKYKKCHLDQDGT